MLGTDLMAQFKHRHEVAGMDIDEINITLASDCRRAVADTGPDLVINAAAFTNVDACETSREECFAVNGEGVRNIALACRDKNIPLVHYSTDYVFDGNSDTPYLEDAPCNPINTYGASKLTGEHYLRQTTDNYLIIRTAWLYGAGGKNFVGAILERARTTGDFRSDQLKALFAKALLPRLGEGAVRVPERTAMVLGLTQDRDRLADYARVCGFPLRDFVPPTWLHVLTFGLHIHLLSGPDCSIRPLWNR